MLTTAAKCQYIDSPSLSHTDTFSPPHSPQHTHTHTSLPHSSQQTDRQTDRQTHTHTHTHTHTYTHTHTHTHTEKTELGRFVTVSRAHETPAIKCQTRREISIVGTSPSTIQSYDWRETNSMLVGTCHSRAPKMSFCDTGTGRER